MKSLPYANPQKPVIHKTVRMGDPLHRVCLSHTCFPSKIQKEVNKCLRFGFEINSEEQ